MWAKAEEYIQKVYLSVADLENEKGGIQTQMLF